MYFFKVNPADGFGICHYYNEEGEEENFTVRDNSIHMMPRGYHTVGQRTGLYHLLPVVPGRQSTHPGRGGRQSVELGQPDSRHVEGVWSMILDSFKLDGKSSPGDRRRAGPGAGHVPGPG